MALTVNNLVGFETSGLDEVAASAGSPDATEATVVRSGGFALKCPGAATPASVDLTIAEGGSSIGGTGNVVGVGVQFSDITPANDIDFLLALDTGATVVMRLRLSATDGDLALVDQAGSEVATVSAPFTANTYHFIEIYWERSATGSAEVFVDNTSKISVSNKDFDAGAVVDIYRLQGSDTASEDTYFDDYYCLTGATSASDRFGDCEIFTYQNSVGGALDQGDVLLSGTWANVSELPLSETNEAEYGGNFQIEGYTRCAAIGGNARPGPSGDANIDGDSNIKAAKWLHRLRRGNGQGRTHSKRYGNTSDVITDTVVSLTTSYQNFFTVSESATIVPLSSEDFAYGFKSSAAAGQHIFCAEIFAFILHVPSAGAPPVGPPLGSLALMGIGR